MVEYITRTRHLSQKNVTQQRQYKLCGGKYMRQETTKGGAWARGGWRGAYH